MFRSVIVMCLLVLFAACRGSDDNATSATSPSAPPPRALPEVDRNFATAQDIDTWRAELAADLATDAAALHPQEIWKYLADFHIDRSRPDPMIGDPAIWDALSATRNPNIYIPSPPVDPTPDQALALEAKSEEWSAAQMWIALGRMEDAKRCSVALEKEGEWKAVATIAVHTGDLNSLDRATKKMVDANQVSNTREVIDYAFKKGKIEVVRHIADHHKWKITDVLDPYQVRELALSDTSILPGLVDTEIAVWEGPPTYQYPPEIVTDIVLLAKTDPVKALEYAGRYLKLPGANVLVWTTCGNGCSSDPIPGALELYQLVRSDKTLREFYFARLRQALDEMFPVNPPVIQPSHVTATINGIQPGKYAGWSSEMWGDGMEGNLLTSYLQRVRQMGDVELTAFWVAMLDTFPTRAGFQHRTLNFERELGRYCLGLSVNPDAEGLSDGEKFALSDLLGRPLPDMTNVWAKWDQKLPTQEELGSVETMFHYRTRGEVTPARFSVILAELDIISDATMQDLRTDIRRLLNHSLQARYGQTTFDERLVKGKRALETNARAKALREQLFLHQIELYPDTAAELDELLAPSIALLCEKIPTRCAHYRPQAPEAAPVAQPASPVQNAAPASAPAAVPSPPPVAPGTDPTKCRFVSGSRPKVDGKYIVTCVEGKYLAIGTYVSGHFEWSEFTLYTR